MEISSLLFWLLRALESPDRKRNQLRSSTRKLQKLNPKMSLSKSKMIVTRLFLKLFLCEYVSLPSPFFLNYDSFKNKQGIKQNRQPSAVAAGRQLKTVGWARALGRFLQFFSFAQRHQHTQTHQDYIVCI